MKISRVVTTLESGPVPTATRDYFKEYFSTEGPLAIFLFHLVGIPLKLFYLAMVENFTPP